MKMDLTDAIIVLMAQKEWSKNKIRALQLLTPKFSKINLDIKCLQKHIEIYDEAVDILSEHSEKTL